MTFASEDIRPSKSRLFSPTRDSWRFLHDLWSQRSPDPQYAGKRVLSTRGFWAAFRSMTNMQMIAHYAPADPKNLEVGEDGLYVQRRLLKLNIQHNLRTTAGLDWENLLLGGGVASSTAGSVTLAYRGTSTSAPTATTLTDTGASWGVNNFKDHWLYAAPASGGLVCARIVSGTSQVQTFDRWTDLNTLNTQAQLTAAGVGSAAATPGGTNTLYAIAPGAGPCIYLAFDSSATTPAAGSTFSSITEVSAAGLARTPCLYAHSGGVTSFTYSKTLTNTSGGASGALNNACLLTTESGTGTLVFYTAIATPPNLANNDQIQIAPWTIND